MKDKFHFIEAVAILVGTTIGAGILAIPYVMAQAGFLTGLLVLVVIAVMVIFLNLMLGQMTLATSELHQLPGYAAKYFGRLGKWSMFVIMIFSLYSALLAYIIGEGQVLTDLFGGSAMVNSYIFFGIGAIFLYFGLNVIKRLEVLLTAVIFIVILLIYYFSRSHIDVINLSTFNYQKILLPYGAILFASMGYSSIPQVREILQGKEKLLKRAILIGTLIPIVIYAVFALVVVGVSGLNTTEVATIGLGRMIGPQMIIFGNLFALVAMATSFLTLGLAIKKTYIQDLHINKDMAWFLTIIVPLLAYTFGLNSFIGVATISGAIAGGLQSILIILIFMKMKQFVRRPEYKIPRNWLLAIPLIIIFLIGILSVLYI